ncbi:MAG: polysaccharide biosynthesis C-terminal domain-containing protein [Sphingobacteriales bacterium]|nr:polysaccharide biosynthesis C-terminal domain-containing protein [Sphingobacteriales bacterium]
MSGIKKLAGQTMWYGVPAIASRFLGYLMNMALPFFVTLPAETADLSQAYSIIPFLNVLYAYGMETAYFRFSQTHDRKKLFSTLFLSMLVSTVLFSIILLLFKDKIVDAATLNQHPEYVLWIIAIISIDNLNTLPFAKLRQENRPKRYAFARVAGIIVNVTIVILFLGVIPKILATHPDSFLKHIYSSDIQLGYYLIGNICGSLFTLLLLWKELRQITFKFDTKLWKEVMRYSAPLVIVGMGGMVNDVLSRLIYRHVVDLPPQQADNEFGIFANIFRIALLVTIVIQAFRMAAEPFFFNQSNNENAQRIYARVMKFFVIACCFIFLFIGLFLDVFHWIFATFANPRWTEGLQVVPLLALGNIFLGIYYNLSVWYKLTNKNLYGAYITIIGAVITIVLNVLLIPVLHYLGAAIATFTCYFTMMVLSYKLGQKHYPVPYAVKKLSAYLIISILLYVIHIALVRFISASYLFSFASGLVLISAFAWFISKTERKELSRMPVIGKFFSPI